MGDKIVPKLLWGVVAVGGVLSFVGLASQANFGLTMANIPAYGVALMMLVFGASKAVGIDIVKIVSVA